MWILFKKDYLENKTGDLVDVECSRTTEKFLVEEKIATVIDNPHETYARIIKNRELNSKVNLTKK